MHTTNSAARRVDVILRALLVALFTIAGAMKLTAHPFEVQGFQHFGYAPWFMYAIGIIEFAGAFALLHVRLLPAASATLGAVLIGAVWSHLKAADPLAMTIPALVMLLMLAWLATIHMSGRKVPERA